MKIIIKGVLFCRMKKRDPVRRKENKECSHRTFRLCRVLNGIRSSKLLNKMEPTLLAYLNLGTISPSDLKPFKAITLVWISFWRKAPSGIAKVERIQIMEMPFRYSIQSSFTALFICYYFINVFLRSSGLIYEKEKQIWEYFTHLK